MQKQTIKSKQEGFTIIEVLIVLAIAALILLVVFLAVPGLQRSQRNNGIQTEASKLSAAITAYVGNNQGNNPTTGSQGDSIVKDAGIGKYITGIASNATANTVALCKFASATVTVCDGSYSPTPPAVSMNTPVGLTAHGILIVDKGVCAGSGLQATTTQGTQTQIALLYTTETATGSYNQVCIQAQ